MKLSLSASTNNWEIFIGRRRTPSFRKLRVKLIVRDHYKCRFCKFISRNLEIVNINGDYNDNRSSNLASACMLCAHATLLDRYAIDYKGEDKIIYLPEITQETLSNLVRVLFCQSSSSSGEPAYNARMTLAQLQNRANILDEKSRIQLSNPAYFGHYQGIDQGDRSLVNKLRWLPSIPSYKGQIQGWAQDIKLNRDQDEFNLDLLDEE